MVCGDNGGFPRSGRSVGFYSPRTQPGVSRSPPPRASTGSIGLFPLWSEVYFLGSLGGVKTPSWGPFWFSGFGPRRGGWAWALPEKVTGFHGPRGGWRSLLLPVLH